MWRVVVCLIDDEYGAVGEFSLGDGLSEAEARTLAGRVAKEVLDTEPSTEPFDPNEIPTPVVRFDGIWDAKWCNLCGSQFVHRKTCPSYRENKK